MTRVVQQSTMKIPPSFLGLLQEAAVLRCIHWQLGFVALAVMSSTAIANDEAAYTRTITERADKIVAPLGIEDAAKAARVRDLLVDQYRRLREIHEARDARLAETDRSPGDPAVAEAFRGAVRKDAALKLFELHRQFVARLEAELTPERVNQVKDGMTYGVVPVTYNRYVELLPDLTVEQKAAIRAHLLEAREYAMDAGSAEEKHAIFGKYKGRINNYLSAAGYNLKQAEKDLAARQKTSSSNP